jgi:2',3'-cyclic-nucleotide 2'-phosphodiesterase (5'-nucleotidase family)
MNGQATAPKLALRLLATCLLVVAPACRAGRSTIDHAGTRPIHLRVLATHDFHGALRPVAYPSLNGRRLGGAAALKTAMDELEAACTCPTARLDGGDQMQGTLESDLTFGASTVAALNHLGLDAAAVGNHELDWGVDTLLIRQREARYAWLAANVYRVDDGKRPEWATPFTTFERGGVKVGVVGYATASTPRTQRPEVTRPYEFRSGYAGIRDALDAVWRERPAFVVLVAHADGDCDAGRCAGEMVDLAAEVPPGRVHLIVGGHDHGAGEGVVNAIPIVRAGSNGRAVGVVDLYRHADGTHTFRMSTRTVDTDAVPHDPAMANLLAPHLRAAEARGQEPVATVSEPLSASRSGDRRLGGLIADAMRVLARADVGLHNPGGVRADLPRGTVSYADVYRVMPFNNAVVRLTLTGRQLRELVERAGARYYYSNLQIDYDTAGSRSGSVRSMRFADGTPFGENRSYSLATSDYLADGGDALTLLTALPREALGVRLVDALVGHLRTLQTPVVQPAATSGQTR